jgi:hypothetical protein
MRNLLEKMNIWLLTSNFKKNGFFDKRIRWQLHSLIICILHPEFRRSWNFKNIIYLNRYSIVFFILIASLLIISFFIGKSFNNRYISDLENKIVDRDSTINYLNQNISFKDSTIYSLSNELKSRSYIQYKVIQESKIEHINNLKLVPDSIFFLMVSQADKYKIPYVIFFRIMEKESKFQFIANKEGSGAFGYMQIVPSTFSIYYKKLNLKGGHTQANNIIVSANLIHSIREFWKTKFKDDRKIWEYTLAEYGCGRRSMMDGNGGYFIPEYAKAGINYVMKFYQKK